MLYLFLGGDKRAIQKKLDSFLEQVRKKKSGISFFELDEESVDVEALKELLHTQGLFEKEHLVVLRRVLGDEDVHDFVFKNLSLFKESPNVFVFAEEELSAESFGAFKEHARKIWEAGAKSSEARKEFNRFALGDAVLERDRKKAWALLCAFIDREGEALESAHGIIFTQVKNLLLVKKELKNPGFHPFVFQKTKQGASNYTTEELETMSQELVILYHDARRGICDLRVALEKFILSI